MDRSTELELIDEILALKAEKSPFLDEAVARNPIDHYTSQERFDLERKHIFRRVPTAVAHASEVSTPGDFLRREVAGLPILITRDKTGKVNAFINACRHRGTRLVDEEAGCKHSFSCPYHAWTYANTGELLAAPHFDTGFPGEQTAELSLKRLDCQERFGFIWVTPETDQQVDLEGMFGDLAVELEALGLDDMVVAHQDTSIRKANWKILVEGGIEAYHFKVAHRTTIGPYFEDNLSTYRSFGPHIRSILARTSLANLTDDTRESWRLRDHAQVLYTLFPSTALLVQQDHVAWVKEEPITPDETRVRLATLVPKSEANKTEHWARNHGITHMTLDEDFAIGESVQSTLASGANAAMLFGRFEGALDQFNRTVETCLSEPDSRAMAAE